MNITFLGSGNIARAIINGLLANGMPASQITAADPFQTALEETVKLGVNTTNDNRAAVSESDVVILSVKPNVVADLAIEIAGDIGERLVISVAAGITSASLLDWLGDDKHIIRCMPNTPAQIQSGITGLYATAAINENEKNIVGQILGAVGEFICVNDESELHAVTAVSGSGPAYFFYVIEAMEKAAIRLGLSSDIARKLVLETAVGTTKMALTQTNKTPEQLRREVTSPGGTTEAAIKTLQEGDLTGLFDRAIASANDRSIELAGNAS